MKAGFIAIVGRPNAGKSTLLNSIIGEKVAIVTSKPQTTRQRVNGIWTEDDFQAIFVDTPGLIKADKGLNRFLNEELNDSIQNADAVLGLLNIDEKDPKKLEQIVDLVKSSNKPYKFIVTKTDLPLERRLPFIQEMLGDDAMATTSSIKKPQELKEKMGEIVKDLLPDSPAPLFDEEIYTSQTVREMACEFVRERCFEYLHQEIPFGLAVRLVSYEEKPRLDRIFLQILVSRENHKSIVIGKGAANLRKIGQEAREQIEKVTGKKVFLDLKVAFKKNWSENKRIMEELGYVVEESK